MAARAVSSFICSSPSVRDVDYRRALMKIPDFELERYFARWEFEARHLLCASDVQALGLQELLTMADPSSRELWEKLQLGYGESPGHPLLREAIAALYEGVEPRQVYTFAG